MGMEKYKKGFSVYLIAICVLSIFFFVSCPTPNTIINVDSISLNETKIDISEGSEVCLKAIVFPENATNKELIWISSDESVASVNQDGVVKGLKEGSTVITVQSSYNSDIKTEAEVTVFKRVAADSIELNEENITLVLSEGEKIYTLKATITPEDATDKTIIWTSNDESVATVSSEGIVTAVGLGNAIISAKIDGTDLKASCSVSVIDEIIPLTGIYSSRDVVYDLWFEEELKLSISPIPENATNPDLYWYSEDEAIASIDSEGLLKCVGTGNTNIVIKSHSYDGVEKKIPVDVRYLPLSAIYLSESELTLSMDGSETLTVSFYPDEVGINRNITWETSDESVATVSSEGVVTAVNAGIATITVHGANETSATCTVTVLGYSIDKDGTWLIYDKTGFKEFFSKNVIGNAILMNDIILNDDTNWENWTEETEGLENWEPVEDFRGTLDGNDHSIRGLYYTFTGSTNNKSGGLFENISSGVVKNLTIESGLISVANAGRYFGTYAGAIAGILEDEGKITNCTNYATVVVSGEQSAYGGGLSGYSSSGSLITESINNGRVETSIHNGSSNSRAYSGGISGYIIDVIGPVFRNNENRGQIEVSSDTGESIYVGGITAMLSNAKIENSKNSGTIKASGSVSSYLGGIAGEVYDGSSSVTASSNEGEIIIESKGNVYAGGVIGYTSDGTIENCHNKGDIKNTESSGQIYVGGVVGFAGAGISNVYNTGDVAIARAYDDIIFETNVGGVIGYYRDDNSTTLSSSYNTGNIFVENKSGAMLFVGGIIGEADGLNIEKAYNEGVIETSSSSDAFVGGIAGFNNGLMTNNTYNVGEIKAKSDGVLLLGGIVGNAGNPNNTQYTYVKNSFNVGRLIDTGSATSSIGAIIGGIVTEENILIAPWYINNSYFLEGTATLGYGYFSNWPTYDGSFEIKNEQEMKSEDFVTLLNSNQAQPAWKASSTGGYPELIF